MALIEGNVEYIDILNHCIINERSWRLHGFMALARAGTRPVGL
jgi:hypothetical protein